MSDPRATPPDPADGPLVLWARWIRAGVLPTLSRSARDVGTALAAYASKDGAAYPSATTIAKLTAHTRTTVFQALAELVAAGVVIRDGHIKRRALNARGPVIYRFQPPPSMCPSEPDTSASETHRLLSRFQNTVTTAPVIPSRRLSEADGGSPARETATMCLCTRDTEVFICILNGKKRRGGRGVQMGTTRRASLRFARLLRRPNRRENPSRL